MPAAVIAVFGPTGVGKTAVAVTLGERLSTLGERPVAVSADALQVYAGLETLTGVASADERARLEHRLVAFLPVDATFSAGQYAELAHAEIDRLLAASQRPIVVGGTGLYLRAALTELSLRPPPAEGVRERWIAELERRGPAVLHARLAERAPWAAAEIEPGDRQRLVRALELLDAGELEPLAGESELWSSAARHPTLLVGLLMEREQLYARLDGRVEAMLAAGVLDEVRRANAAGASGTARKALGFDELLAGDIEAMKRRTRNYARRQLTWMRKLAGVNLIDVTVRDPDEVAAEIVALWQRWRAMNFEKWQALGNDYVILEERNVSLELTPARIRAICAQHTGVCSDGVLLLSDGEPPRMRVFNPDGSEAEVSGNGARQAILYLHRHGYSGPIATAAGELRPTITSQTTCMVDMGHARLVSADYPGGPDGVGELTAGGRAWRFRHVQVGNPQCAIGVASADELEAVDITRIGPEIERHELFPNRTNVSWFASLGPGRIRARIFERGAGETSASGTGATGAAVAYVLDGGSSPVTVALDGGELEVEVGEDLHVDLSGWAVPVFRGALADDFVKELDAIE